MTDKKPIVGPRWDDDGSWHYTLADPDGGQDWVLAVQPRKNSERVVLSLWQGDDEGPGPSDDIAMSEPIDLPRDEDIESFNDEVEAVFGKPVREWFSLRMRNIQKRHARDAQKVARENLVREIREKAERRIPGEPNYYVSEDGFAAVLRDNYVQLSNFSARIVEELLIDVGTDGDPERKYRLIARRSKGKPIDFTIPAHEFSSLKWVSTHLGSKAIIAPLVPKANQHIRTAILRDSDAEERRVFGHTGWRLINDQWVYLHAGGAIGPFGQTVNGIEVALPKDLGLGRRRLPAPVLGEDLRAAIHADLRLWDLADDSVSIPLFASIYRAAMGQSDFNIHLSGPTGEGKTALSLVLFNHFHDRRLKDGDGTNYWSTPNSIEEKAFYLKDQVLLVDDYRATPEHQALMDRAFRSTASHSGRGRMGRASRPPRALVLSTGEDVPKGSPSLTARALILEVPQGGGPVSLHPEALGRAQAAAANGTLALAMAGFLSYLAGLPRVDLEREKDPFARKARGKGGHNRKPDTYADLVVGLRTYLDYARFARAIGEDDYSELLGRGMAAITQAITRQAVHQSQVDYIERFRGLLNQALLTGRAHLGNEGQGIRVGYLVKGHLYLIPEAAYSVATAVALATGEPLGISREALGKRLYETGRLAQHGMDAKQPKVAVKRRVDGEPVRVWVLPPTFLSEGG